MLIRMRARIPGDRDDGRDWPDAGGLIEVPDAEAASLVRSGAAWPGDGFAIERLAEMGEAARPPGVPWSQVEGEALAAMMPAAGEEPWEGGPSPPAEPAAEQEPASPVAEPAEAAEPGPAEAEAAAAADGAAEAGPQAPPAPSDIKQKWIDYAVSQGEDPETARDMTKVDLMSKYGGRL